MKNSWAKIVANSHGALSKPKQAAVSEKTNDCPPTSGVYDRA
jgi:hypothetical protein